MDKKGYHFDEKRHIHTYDGKNMHGVTSVLRMWGDPGSLVNWAANQAVDAMLQGVSHEDARKAHITKRDKAGDKGKEVHSALEKEMNVWIKTGKPGEIVEPVTGSVINWMVNEGYRPLRSEMPVYHLDLWYAGILDAAVEKDGKKYILDFKTSGSLQTKNFYQCGAYSLAIKDMKEEAQVDGAIIVHIPRGESFKPDVNVYIRYDIGHLEDAFKDILSVYKLDQEITKLIKY